MKQTEDTRPTLWDRMTPQQRRVAQSKDRADAAARAAKNLARAGHWPKRIR